MDRDGQAPCLGGPLRWRVPRSPQDAREELGPHRTVAVVLPKRNTKEESVTITTKGQLGPFLCAQRVYDCVVIQSPTVAVAGKTCPVSFIKRHNTCLWPTNLAWLEHCPVNGKVRRLIPSQGSYLCHG